MKLLTKQAFVNMHPDKRRQQFVGHFKTEDGMVEVYERGKDDEAWLNAISELDKRFGSTATPAPSENGFLEDIFGGDEDDVEAAGEWSADAKALMGGTSLNLDQLSNILREILLKLQ